MINMVSFMIYVFTTLKKADGWCPGVTEEQESRTGGIKRAHKEMSNIKIKVHSWIYLKCIIVNIKVIKLSKY